MFSLISMVKEVRFTKTCNFIVSHQCYTLNSTGFLLGSSCWRHLSNNVKVVCCDCITNLTSVVGPADKASNNVDFIIKTIYPMFN